MQVLLRARNIVAERAKLFRHVVAVISKVGKKILRNIKVFKAFGGRNKVGKKSIIIEM